MRHLLLSLCAGVSVALSTTASALITVGTFTANYVISAVDVQVVGNLAYVADADVGLRIIDVSDPAAPVELGTLGTLYGADDIEVVDDRVYLVGLTFNDPPSLDGCASSMCPIPPRPSRSVCSTHQSIHSRSRW
jgi:hypothetical protein